MPTGSEPEPAPLTQPRATSPAPAASPPPAMSPAAASPAAASPAPALPPALLVSACLLGVRCNHRGEGSPSAAVAALRDRYRLIPVCPETLGGLPTPRQAAELQADGSVRTADGEDVTAAYRRGADAAVALARTVGATEAVLKARSPSCGLHAVYDGTFSRTVVPGHGVTAAALAEAGLALRDEEDVEGA